MSKNVVVQNETHIKVICRVRPFNELEKTQGGGLMCVSFNNKAIKLKVQGDDNKYDFSFDHVFGPETTQIEIFDTVAKPVIESVMNGFNATIFAYGQTSSGKTFTMEGPSIDSYENKGIIPRMMDHVFESILNANENLEFTVKVSFLEIYNEKIQDLIDVRKNHLHIKEDRLHGIYVQDATEVYVYSSEQMKKVMKTGAENRTIAATRMNERSSRSHSIFILSLFQKDIQNDTTRQSRLFFVDLAGSEKIAKTQVSGAQLEEAKNINKSLSALGNVINALTSEKKEHVPYRDSKLTRLLQDSLGGNSKTTLILACSPCAYNDKETLSTLRFGNRAKSIKNTPIVNEEKSVKELKSLLEQAEKKINQQEMIIEKLENELGKKGVTETEFRIITEIDEDSQSFRNNNTPRNSNLSYKALTEESKPIAMVESVDLRPKEKQQNSSLRLLKQHIQITNLHEELKTLKIEKKELENELIAQKNENEEINDKLILSEETSNATISKYNSQIQQLHVTIEKLFYENQSSSHLVSKLKRELARLKSDLNFLLISNSLKDLAGITNSNQNTSLLSPLKKEDSNNLDFQSGFEDPAYFIEKIAENIHKIIVIIENVDEIIDQTKNNINPSIIEVKNIHNHTEDLKEGNFETLPSSEETSMTPLKIPKIQKIKIINSHCDSGENTSRDDDKGSRNNMPMTERKLPFDINNDINLLNNFEKMAGTNYDETLEKIKECQSVEEKIQELYELIANQRKTITSLTKMNQELTFTVDSYNNVFEKKIEKYKKRIKEINKLSIEKEKESIKKIENLEEILKEKSKEYVQNKTKYVTEIDKKNSELSEFKIHLEKLQQFLSNNKETKFLLEMDNKVKDLITERQKLFNELYKLRSEIDEKDEAISERNTQIYILQNNMTTLKNELQSYDLKKHSNLLPNLEEMPIDNTMTQNHKKKDNEKDKSGLFIDKHIIRTIRGGGGNIQTFQKNNHLIKKDNSSDSSSDEDNLTNNNFENKKSNFNKASLKLNLDNSSFEPNFKKKNIDSFKVFDDFIKTGRNEIPISTNTPLRKEFEKKEKNEMFLKKKDNRDEIEEDLKLFNQPKKQDVEKKFKNIQNNIKEKSSMKNLFSNVKRLFI